MAAAMKDSDEGEAVKHGGDVIYLLIERIHHTDRLSFKFVLFQPSPVQINTKANITRCIHG